MSWSDADHTLTHKCAATVRRVRYQSVSSLTFLIWNSIVTFDDEVEYIWTCVMSLVVLGNPFKWAYFVFRYAVIIAHVTHNILMEPLANGSNPSSLCKFWWTYINCFSQFLGTLLELVLASRVLAFYNRSRRVALLLSIVILAEVAGAVRMVWSRGKLRFYESCLLMLGSNSNEEQSMIVFACHCTLISLTLFKYVSALRGGWGRTPLVSLVIRDVSTAYALVFALIITVFAISPASEERVAIFFWFTSLNSALGCHMILNMERLARRDVPTGAGHPMLTSQLSMSSTSESTDPTRRHEGSYPLVSLPRRPL